MVLCADPHSTFRTAVEGLAAAQGAMAAPVPAHTLGNYLASHVFRRAQQLFEAALTPFVKKCMAEAFPLVCVCANPSFFALRFFRFFPLL